PRGQPRPSAVVGVENSASRTTDNRNSRCRTTRRPSNRIYVRVSTKEQTENLSLPTQLRACEEYCRHQGYEILERFREEGESAKTTDRSQLQPPEQGPCPFRGRVHPDALRAGQVRPLRAPLSPAIAGHLAAVGNGAD